MQANQILVATLCPSRARPTSTKEQRRASWETEPNCKRVSKNREVCSSSSPCVAHARAASRSVKIVYPVQGLSRILWALSGFVQSS